MIRPANELSPSQAAIARKNEREILHALARVSARQVCAASGLSESYLCRLKDERLEQYCAALAAMGLKLVAIDAEIVSRAEKRFMAEKMIDHYQAVLHELEE